MTFAQEIVCPVATIVFLSLSYSIYALVARLCLYATI